MVKNAYIFIQARMNSTRLPGKVMKLIKNKPIIDILIERARTAELPIILATSIKKENNILVNYVENCGVEIFRGSEENALERFYKAAEKYKSDIIIRLTGDNPLIDGNVIKEALNTYLKYNNNRTYLSTGLSKTFPLGISVEIFSIELLKEAFQNAKSQGEREHITPYMNQNIPGDINTVAFDGKMLKYHYRLTIDTKEDFNLHKLLIEKYNADKLSILEIVDILDEHPEIPLINSMIIQKT